MVSRPSRRRITRAQVRAASLLAAMLVPLLAASTNPAANDTPRPVILETARRATRTGAPVCGERHTVVTERPRRSDLETRTGPSSCARP